MDNCSIELLQKIFSYACTDGGRTGCALSLVSHWIRAVATPVRFQTVSLTNVSQMRLFLSMLEAMPNPPRVSHLFLSHHACPARISLMLSCDHTECISIVSLLSASLISLGAHLVHLPIKSTSLLQSKLSFPLLQDLSIGCSCGNMATSGLPLFPSLRRFHQFFTGSGSHLVRPCISPIDTHSSFQHCPGFVVYWLPP
jgi:hypothetical protein